MAKILINGNLGTFSVELSPSKENWELVNKEQQKEYLKHNIRTEILDSLDDIIDNMIEQDNILVVED